MSTRTSIDASTTMAAPQSHPSVDDAAPNTPAEQVVAVTELHKEILLQLPFSELLYLRCLSKHWKALIETSLPLRENLFFSASGTHTFDLYTPDNAKAGIHYVGPDLNGKNFPTVNRLVKMTVLDDTMYPVAKTPTDLRLELRNPSTGRNRDYFHDRSPTRTCLSYLIHFDTIMHGAPVDKFFSRSDLLRSMYLTQPPVPAAQLSVDTWGRFVYSTASVWLADGITFGDVFDVFEAMLRTHAAPEGSEVWMCIYFSFLHQGNTISEDC
jgi:hypothetical protein